MFCKQFYYLLGIVLLCMKILFEVLEFQLFEVESLCRRHKKFFHLEFSQYGKRLYKPYFFFKIANHFLARILFTLIFHREFIIHLSIVCFAEKSHKWLKFIFIYLLNKRTFEIPKMRKRVRKKLQLENYFQFGEITVCTSEWIF